MICTLMTVSRFTAPRFTARLTGTAGCSALAGVSTAGAAVRAISDYVPARLTAMRQEIADTTERINALLLVPASDSRDSLLSLLTDRRTVKIQQLRKAETRVITPSVTLDDWSRGWHDVYVED